MIKVEKVWLRFIRAVSVNLSIDGRITACSFAKNSISADILMIVGSFFSLFSRLCCFLHTFKLDFVLFQLLFRSSVVVADQRADQLFFAFSANVAYVTLLRVS